MLKKELSLKTHPKRQYVRSAKLLNNIRFLHCHACGADDQTIVGAHSNSQAHGKGRGIKSDDNMVAALCWDCHHTLDQGHYLSKEEKEKFWMYAHLRTVFSLIKAELWPPTVPLPQTYLDFQNKLN